jgi:GntP family gluconate:H+ symporter
MTDTWVTLGVLLLGVIAVVGGILVLRLHAFLALVFGAIVVATLTPRDNIVQYYVDSKGLSSEEAAAQADRTVPSRVAQGFGDTCTKIGILIAMAAIIGKCLLDSGAADRIVRTALGWFGEKGAPFAFLTSGFALGIPVFFDTVFYLMIPLGKALRTRTGRNYLLYVLTIVCGATMAHSLVPPTPGPLFVAGELGVDLGLMILAGGIVGLFTAGVGYFYAIFANRIWDLPLRASADLSLEELEAAARVDESELPPFWLSLVPIVLPVVLISGQTILKKGFFGVTAPDGVIRIADTLGDKTIALTLSAIIAMGTVVWQKRTSLKELSESVQKALASGGVIILITAAGGAFGDVLRQTNVAGLIRDLPDMSPAVICATAWLITTAIRTAQGSATVAMITAVGILSDLATGGDLPFHPVYLALAIGCGSKPVAWMNDSGFWVITRMSGMTEVEGLKYVTPMTTIMGVVGLAVVLIGVTVMPTF